MAGQNITSKRPLYRSRVLTVDLSDIGPSTEISAICRLHLATTDVTVGETGGLYTAGVRGVRFTGFKADNNNGIACIMINVLANK